MENPHVSDISVAQSKSIQEKPIFLKGGSKGERALLSLAQIAAKVPKLLILDEITNNIDLETRNHVVEVLHEYPSALIVVSHDEAFLDKIGVEKKDCHAATFWSRVNIVLSEVLT